MHGWHICRNKIINPKVYFFEKTMNVVIIVASK